MKKLIILAAITISSLSVFGQTERCDSLIGEWLLTQMQYKFSKEPIVFSEQYQDYISISRVGINYQLLVNSNDLGPILITTPTTDPNDLLKGLGGIGKIEIISILPNEIIFKGEKDGRNCTATLTRKSN